ncbi:SDR family oxidoreductase [Arenibaculum pallidiluteum]|uniref:SDR family oxidoreductase n=1 Tax=Arenibaculum pallidiluteum TaxID=2812559 RepID=UPI001A96A10A|nr:SDR family oxidoreductase [Arenibaculum pallidiluteum]
MSHPLFDLAGRVVLLTGSSRGLGLAMARGLAQAGARVVLNGRDPAALDAAVAALRAEGHDASAALFDVTDEAGIEAAVEAIETQTGPIAALFNNAGIQRRVPLLDLDRATWDEVMAGNLSSVFLVGRAVARRMVPRGAGKIVNVASLMSEVARPSVGAYTAAKGAVRTLTRAMCVEWAPHGLQVNAIGPGYFRTEMNRALTEDPAFDAWIRGRTPARRWGDPSELVGAAVFLASPASDFVNGQVIYVDGGILAAL